MRFALLLISAICVTVPAYGQQAAPVAVPVGVVQAERKPISATADFVGRVDAINRVEIRARVKGFLDAVLFKEGDVDQGRSPALPDREGTVPGRGRAGARRAGAQQGGKNAHRNSAAARRGAVDASKPAPPWRATRRSPRTSRPRGTILSDQANLQTAKINLGYTDITSPIAGKIGRTNITKGNVVGPDSGVARPSIVSQDPMYVTFPVSQREFLRRPARAVSSVDVKDIKVSLRFPTAPIYDQTGRDQFRRRDRRSRHRHGPCARHVSPIRRAC